MTEASFVSPYFSASPSATVIFCGLKIKPSLASDAANVIETLLFSAASAANAVTGTIPTSIITASISARILFFIFYFLSILSLNIFSNEIGSKNEAVTADNSAATAFSHANIKLPKHALPHAES